MYNYRKVMMEDIREWINDENNLTLTDWTRDRYELEEYLNDTLWVEDSITGNGSGSYTSTNVEASLYVLDNVHLLKQAIKEFSVDSETVASKFLEEDWKYFDVTIRCYMLNEAISYVLDEMEKDGLLTI